jgi:hypothetical protein
MIEFLLPSKFQMNLIDDKDPYHRNMYYEIFRLTKSEGMFTQHFFFLKFFFGFEILIILIFFICVVYHIYIVFFMRLITHLVTNFTREMMLENMTILLSKYSPNHLDSSLISYLACLVSHGIVGITGHKFMIDYLNSV